MTKFGCHDDDFMVTSESGVGEAATFTTVRELSRDVVGVSFGDVKRGRQEKGCEVKGLLSLDVS